MLVRHFIIACTFAFSGSAFGQSGARLELRSPGPVTAQPGARLQLELSGGPQKPYAMLTMGRDRPLVLGGGYTSSAGKAIYSLPVSPVPGMLPYLPKTILPLAAIILSSSFSVSNILWPEFVLRAPGHTRLHPVWSTSRGGWGSESFRDVLVDPITHNRVMVGGTSTVGPAPFPHDMTFVMADSKGQEICSDGGGWGDSYSRAYAVARDSAGNFYAAGRGGADFPGPGHRHLLSGFQTQFGGGVVKAPYGSQDGFIVKFDSRCRPLVITLMGGGGNAFIRDLRYHPGRNSLIAATAFGPNDEDFLQRHRVNIIGKRDSSTLHDAAYLEISTDLKLLNFTVIAGNREEWGTNAVAISRGGSIAFEFPTNSTNLPLTATSADKVLNDGNTRHSDFFLMVTKPNVFPTSMSDFLWTTYHGGKYDEDAERKNIAFDYQERLHVGATTLSPDFFSAQNLTPRRTYRGTGGAGQGQNSNWRGDIHVAIYGRDGRPLRHTYVGGSYGDGVEGIELDVYGNVYLSGASFSLDFPTTPSAFQPRHALNASTRGWDGMDGVLVKLDSALDIQFASYHGGRLSDALRSIALHFDERAGEFHVVAVGTSASTNLPIYGMGRANHNNEDAILIDTVAR